MALKGIGISDDIFVDQTYHTPEDYTLPTPSQGDYATPQTYFQADYVNNALDLVSTFTIQAEGTVFSTRATPASEFTLTVSCERNRDLGAQSLSSSFTVTAEGSDFDFAILPQITAFSPRFLRAVVTTIGHMPDATWNTYAESEYIDRTWDEFSDYQWDYLDDVFIRSTFTKALGGYLAKATATLTAFNNASITMTRFREFSATPPTVSTMSVNANYTTGTPQTITAVAAQVAELKRFRGVSTNGTPYETTAVSTIAANANFFSRSTVVGYTSRATVSANANVSFVAASSLESAWAQSVDANFNVASGTTALEALYSQLSAGRLITLPDPWNIIRVKQEIRTIVAPAENRLLEVNQETRVNSITTENRLLRVPQETRSYQIFRPGFTNRSSIPKVRSET